MNEKRQIIKLITVDILSAAISWMVFFVFRDYFIEGGNSIYQLVSTLDPNLKMGVIYVPIFWLLVYIISGNYNKVYRKPRLREMRITFSQTLVGALILFFLLLIDDEVSSYKSYYISLISFFVIHFTFTAIPRFLLISAIKKKLSKRIFGFNTILIGSGEKAMNLFKELNNERNNMGYKFVGYVNINGENNGNLSEFIPHLGQLKDLESIVTNHEIEDVIIACDSSEHDSLKEIIYRLENASVHIKVMPDMYDIITGSVKMNHLFGAPLIEVKTELLPFWQKLVKRSIDIVFSALVLVLLFWFYLLLAIGVYLTSKGPIFYSHERVGIKGRKFRIMKFRTMYLDSEKGGPQLSRQNDSRITRFGKFLRKTRLDELPQFYNVLIGEMSIVGPRPERQFFIDKIIKEAPHYAHLHKVRPGITSWGQVKYGYAENVGQMIERLKYDVIYIENMSLALDFKIMFYTVYIIFRGAGV
jgi:exopolysaccharide biosynthesis polyprenyl glycosylphosphotransferase